MQEPRQRQQRQRLFIVGGIVLLLVVIGIAGGIYYYMSQPEEIPVELPSEDEEIPMREVLVARQPIPRGSSLPFDALQTEERDARQFPDDTDVLTRKNETVNKIAIVEIPQGAVIYESYLGGRGTLEEDAAFLIPPGHVMVAFPINMTSSVAYAIKPGDVVDVLISISFVDIDPEFQTILPNLSSFLSEDVDGTIQTTLYTEEGRLIIEDEDFPSIVYPSERQRARRATQITVQRAKVIRVGPWLEMPEPEPEPVEEGQPPPTPTPDVPKVTSLAVLPQEALVLLWAKETKAHMELALRAAGDENAEQSTEAVTLQYMLTRFNLAIPPKLEFGIQRTSQ